MPMEKITQQDIEFLKEAVQLSGEAVSKNLGGPFGCVIVKDGIIISKGYNKVTASSDPTAHAEVVAIREACKLLNNHQLTGCVVYASCEPCPMCLGAIYWARPDKLIYANTRYQAAAIHFDDQFIYDEINKEAATRQIPFIHHPLPEADEVFDSWLKNDNRVEY